MSCRGRRSGLLLGGLQILQDSPNGLEDILLGELRELAILLERMRTTPAHDQLLAVMEEPRTELRIRADRAEVDTAHVDLALPPLGLADRRHGARELQVDGPVHLYPDIVFAAGILDVLGPDDHICPGLERCFPQTRVVPHTGELYAAGESVTPTQTLEISL